MQSYLIPNMTNVTVIAKSEMYQSQILQVEHLRQKGVNKILARFENGDIKIFSADFKKFEKV